MKKQTLVLVLLLTLTLFLVGCTTSQNNQVTGQATGPYYSPPPGQAPAPASAPQPLATGGGCGI